jgi:hypothetical protein
MLRNGWRVRDGEDVGMGGAGGLLGEVEFR